MTETASVTAVLRKPFKPEEIGKLPRVTCRECSKGTCREHERRWCDTCKSSVSERHIHLDYVGHADVTSRLLEADPEWTWEPQARDVDPAALAAAVATGNPEVVRMVLENAPPKFDLDRNGEPVGLWIRLTAGGVTRPGHGSCPSGQNDAVKVLIGDALRNAAMRFGVAVDLWAKGDRSDPAAENATASGGQAARRGGSQSGNGRPANGTAVRPAQAARPASPPEGEADKDAQAFADEAALVTTIAALRDVHVRARNAHKLAALIREPGGEHIDGLGAYFNYRKSALEKAEQALRNLRFVAAGAGITSEEELERRVVAACKKGIEEATAEDLERATELILRGAGVAA